TASGTPRQRPATDAKAPPAIAPGPRRPVDAPRRPATEEPTQLSPAVPSHRRPYRRFQIVGAFILVAGAVVGSYTALSKSPPPPSHPVADATVLPPSQGVPNQDALWQAYVKKKAEVAAAQEAERVRRANEVAAAQAAAAKQATPNVPSSCN